MRIRKTLITLLTLAIAIALSPWAELRAASLISPGLAQGAATLTQTVKAEKKARKTGKSRKKGRKHRGKRAGSKGGGRCGAFMYYSKKSHKCMDARKK